MKKIGLLTAALIINAAVFAQTAENKNEQGTSVSTAARSESQINGKGEIVSSTASLNSHGSIKAAKPHTSDNADRNRENKEAAAARKDEAKAVLGGKVKANKEAVISRKDESAAHTRENKDAAKAHQAEAKARIGARAEAGLDVAENAGASAAGRADAASGRATGAHAEGSANSAGKVHIRRPNVSGSIGAAGGLRL